MDDFYLLIKNNNNVISSGSPVFRSDLVRPSHELTNFACT